MQGQEPPTIDILVPAKVHYNLSMLENMDDNDYLAEVLTIFLRDTAQELKEMKEAVKAGQTAIIAQKAHKIKGSAGVIEATEMCNLLNRIEEIAKTATINDILKSLIEDTQQLFNNIAQPLKIHIKQLS